MTYLVYFIAAVLLTLALLFYFKLAFRHRIIDKPNERSSHQSFTIRGGGIIFPLSMLMAGILHPSEYYFPVLAVLIVAFVSFLDDWNPLSRRLRVFIHLIAASILFYYLGIFSQFPFWAWLIFYILVIGVINAYNFMDGINGITGLYSIVVLGMLQYVNYHSAIYIAPSIKHFISPDLIWLPMIACVIFLFFNFRKKARCFAGDVGSISMALWVVFLIFKLILASNYLLIYVLFLTVYGVDSVLTIVHRLIRKENIFQPHRIHFFQLLANEKGWSHRLVAILYATLQVIISIIVLVLMPVMPDLILGLIIVIPLILVYVLIKPRLMRLREEQINKTNYGTPSNKQ